MSQQCVRCVCVCPSVLCTRKMYALTHPSTRDDRRTNGRANNIEVEYSRCVATGPLFQSLNFVKRAPMDLWPAIDREREHSPAKASISSWSTSKCSSRRSASKSAIANEIHASGDSIMQRIDERENHRALNSPASCVRMHQPTAPEFVAS